MTDEDLAARASRLAGRPGRAVGAPRRHPAGTSRIVAAGAERDGVVRTDRGVDTREPGPDRRRRRARRRSGARHGDDRSPECRHRADHCGAAAEHHRRARCRARCAVGAPRRARTTAPHPGTGTAPRAGTCAGTCTGTCAAPRAGDHHEDELMVPTTVMPIEARFRAMGSDVHVVVVDGSPDHLRAARGRIDELESRWSRFRPDSEVTRINSAGGEPVTVSADTRTAITAAVEAWRSTDGRFDPTVLPALVAIGYDRDFARIEREVAGAAPDSPPPGIPAPGAAGIAIDDATGTVALPLGTRVDLGGIGKGLAADLVVEQLLRSGAGGACVNVGGDVRAAGTPPSDAGWVVAVERVADALLALADGGIATSSSLRRRWVRAGAPCHHLLDPFRGAPAFTGVLAVTVVAATAATAEVLTKAVFVAGVEPGAELVEQAGATGLIVTESHAVRPLRGLEEYLR